MTTDPNWSVRKFLSPVPNLITQPRNQIGKNDHMDRMKAMLIEGPLYGRALQAGVRICQNPKSAYSLLTNDEKNALKSIFLQLGNNGYKLDREEILENMHQVITLGIYSRFHKPNIDTVSEIIKEVNKTLHMSSKHDILNREDGPVNGRKEHRSNNFLSVKQNGVGFQDDSKYDSDDENTVVIKIDSKLQGNNHKISAPPQLQQSVSNLVQEDFLVINDEFSFDENHHHVFKHDQQSSNESLYDFIPEKLKSNETVPENTTLDTQDPEGIDFDVYKTRGRQPSRSNESEIEEGAPINRPRYPQFNVIYQEGKRNSVDSEPQIRSQIPDPNVKGNRNSFSSNESLYELKDEETPLQTKSDNVGDQTLESPDNETEMEVWNQINTRGRSGYNGRQSGDEI